MDVHPVSHIVRVAQAGPGTPQRTGDGAGRVSLATVVAQLERLGELRVAAGRDEEPFEVTACILEPPPVGAIAAWSEAGVHRMIVKPWGRTRDTIDAIRRFARVYAEVMDR